MAESQERKSRHDESEETGETPEKVEAQESVVESPEQKKEREYQENTARLLERAREYLETQKAQTSARGSAEPPAPPLAEPAPLPTMADAREQWEKNRGWKDGIRRFRLRLAGVEQPDETMALVDYLEHHLKDKEDRYIRVAAARKESEMEKYRQLGYEIFDDYSSSDTDKNVMFRIEKEISYRVSRKDEKKLAELLGRANDPIETVERLRRFGFSIDAHTIRYQSDALRDFVSSPEILETLATLEQANIRPHYTSYFHYRDDKWDRMFSAADAIRELARDPEKRTQLNHENLERIAELKVAGLRIFLDEHWEDAMRVAGDQDATVCLTAMARQMQPDRLSYDSDTLLKEAIMLQDAGLTQSLAQTVRASPWLGREIFQEISRASPYYYGHSAEEARESRIRKVNEFFALPAVQEMRADPSLAAFVEDAVMLVGSTLSLENAESCVSLRKYPETIPLLEMCRELAVSLIQTGVGGYAISDDIHAILADQEMRIRKDLLAPEFFEFASRIKEELGYQLRLEDFLSHTYMYSGARGGAYPGPIVQLFRDPLWREGMASGRASALIKKFGEFHLEQTNFYVNLLRIPNSLEVLGTLEQKFGLDVSHAIESRGALRFDIFAFLQVCENERLQSNLFDERTVQFFARLEEATGYAFHFDDMSGLIDASRDTAVMENEERIFDAAKRLRECGFRFDSIGHSVIDRVPRLLDIVRNDLTAVFEQFGDQPNMHEFLWGHVEELSRIAPEKRGDYIEIFLKIDASPSQEIQRLKDSLLGQILATDSPKGSYQKIEDVFVKNNLPTIGKVYKVFEILHPPSEMEKKLKQGTLGSPVLATASARRRYGVIYHDLLRAHIESGNRSLRQYMETLQSGEDILRKVEEGEAGDLSDTEQKQLRYVLEKFHTLFVNSTLGKNIDMAQDGMSREDHYRYLREGLGVREGQRISQRIGEMFLRPLGMESLDGALARMREAKQNAHERNMEFFRESGGVFALRGGDLLKGVQSQYLPVILQNGSVSKEFLGAAATSDQTPFDTDVSMVSAEDAAGGFSETVQRSLATSYGDLMLAVRDRGQFQHTQARERGRYDSELLELFPTGGGKHYGIRTGFPSTEVDLFVAKDDFLRNARSLEKVYYEIGQNGWYIPVCNTRGEVIFTPDLYREYRKTFNGLDRFDGDPLETVLMDADDPLALRLRAIGETKRDDEENLARVSAGVKQIVASVLAEGHIRMREEFDSSIIGAEIFDIGSTGRNTNAPGSYDFDLTLILDAADFPRAQEIAAKVKEKFRMEQDQSHSEASGYYQLRTKGVTQIGDVRLKNPIDIDIGFAKKSDLAVFGSHDAVREKLDWIRSNRGDEAYQQVVSSIVLTKQILNEGNAYKRVEHGGFGGIGVENWLLYHDGNMRDAFRSFRDAAHENGARIPFERFTRKYKILNPGMNLKNLYHDNYIENLKPEGYERMLVAIESFLET